jgi:hypothetical protein
LVYGKIEVYSFLCCDVDCRAYTWVRDTIDAFNEASLINSDLVIDTGKIFYLRKLMGEFSMWISIAYLIK